MVSPKFNTPPVTLKALVSTPPDQEFMLNTPPSTAISLTDNAIPPTPAPRIVSVPLLFFTTSSNVAF